MSRTVMARLTIDGVQGVITGFRQVGQAAVEYSRTAQKAGTTATRWMDKHSDQLGRLGGTLLKVGAVGALALGGLAKSAIDWESAWAGVTKTVDGTPQQMAAIEAGLRSMAKELPSSHREIAAVAEAAGQL
ncbi:phage tail tape measure protein, partial [Collinsella sp. LCP21S3_A9]